MLDRIKQKQFSQTMFKHFLLLALLFPLYSSEVGSPYAPSLVYPNLFVTAFIVMAFLEGNLEWKPKHYLGLGLLFCLLCFNIAAFYVNKTYFGWYIGQWNVTVSFLFFLCLFFMKDAAFCQEEATIKFVLAAVIITNLLGVVPGLLGYRSVGITHEGYYLVENTKKDTVYTWIYAHKSEYSFTLILFTALAVTYRRLFSKKWQFWGSIAVFAVGLITANTRTSMLAALCIPAGYLLDRMVKQSKKAAWKWLLGLALILIAAVVMLLLFSEERKIVTLGGRTHIWKGAILYILDNPYGVGAMCGLQNFSVEGIQFKVWNCHNVFLNLLLQFSIPAGSFCVVMILGIFAAALKKNFSFQTAGILLALFIPMNMDWCLLIGQMPLFLMVLYFLFFHPLRNPPPVPQ